MRYQLQSGAAFDSNALKCNVECLLAEYGGERRIPSIHLVAYQHGVEQLQLAAGDVQADSAQIDAHRLYRIASMTKPVTAVAFLMLMERGGVALDTPVTDLLPEWEGLRPASVPMLRPLTMLDLLTHQAGLSYSLQPHCAVGAAYGAAGVDHFLPSLDAAGRLHAIAAQPLLFSPGEHWRYSAASDVLGIIIERLTGQDLQSWFTANIFAPLGMTDSFFVVPKDRLSRLTDAWMLGDDGQPTLYDRGAHSRWRRTPPSFSGGAGLVSTIADYSRFAHMLLNGGQGEGGVRLLRPETVALMTRNHLPGNADLGTHAFGLFNGRPGRGMGYGLGVGVTLDDPEINDLGSPGSFHWSGLFSTGFLVDPARSLVAIVMAQMMPSTAFNLDRACWRMIYAALAERNRG